MLFMAILSVATCFLAASLFIVLIVRRDTGRDLPQQPAPVQPEQQRDHEMYATVPEQWLGLPPTDIESCRDDGSKYERAPTEQAMVALDFSHLTKSFNPDEPFGKNQPVAYILDSAIDVSGESYDKMMTANMGTIQEFSAELKLDENSQISQALEQVKNQTSPSRSLDNSVASVASVESRQQQPNTFRVKRGLPPREKPRHITFASSVEVFETYSVEDYDRKPIVNKTPGRTLKRIRRPALTKSSLCC
jgi:hypothetical protein